MKHPKTTICGVLAILGALCNIVSAIVAGQTPDLAANGPAIAAGLAAIFAADGSKVTPTNNTTTTP